MDDLKRCPFCGSMAELRSTRSPNKHTHFTFVKCISCHATSNSIKTEGEPAEKIKNMVIKDWNRRYEN